MLPAMCYALMPIGICALSDSFIQTTAICWSYHKPDFHIVSMETDREAVNHTPILTEITEARQT
jgi:hypothetical protein